MTIDSAAQFWQSLQEDPSLQEAVSGIEAETPTEALPRLVEIAAEHGFECSDVEIGHVIGAIYPQALSEEDLARVAGGVSLTFEKINPSLRANPDKVTDYISTEVYHQHNPSVGDGLAALGAALQAMAEAGMRRVRDEFDLERCIQPLAARFGLEEPAEPRQAHG